MYRQDLSGFSSTDAGIRSRHPLILCGLFCAGKSTLGAELAAQEGLPFYDTDRILEVAHGKSVSALWREYGEETFRDHETKLLLTLKNEKSVIATGGGTLLREENRVHLKLLGKTIYLKVPVHVICERLQNRGLPAYLDPNNPYEHVKRLAEERFHIFEAFCDYVFETKGFADDLRKNFLSLFRSVSSIR